MFLGSMMSSEKTAAAAGTVGELRFDPFAMLPVLRLQHGRLLRPLAADRRARDGAKLPKIFYVNWFRKDADGRFLWPGFGENSRVLAWVFARCAGHGAARETPIGLIPPVGRRRHRHTRARRLRARTMAELLRVDVEEWRGAAAAVPRAPARKFEQPARSELHAQLDGARGAPGLALAAARIGLAASRARASRPRRRAGATPRPAR